MNTRLQHIAAETDQLMRAHEVAHVLALSPRMVWALSARGELHPLRLGGRATRWRRSDVEALIARRAAEAEGAR